VGAWHGPHWSEVRGLKGGGDEKRKQSQKRPIDLKVNSQTHKHKTAESSRLSAEDKQQERPSEFIDRT
jgi:hypothetical protein